jgi:hypothetical protein
LGERITKGFIFPVVRGKKTSEEFIDKKTKYIFKLLLFTMSEIRIKIVVFY